MGARSTGLTARRGTQVDAATILVGYVAAGARGRAAATRTGGQLLLTTNIGLQDVFKIIVYGQSSDAAGGYIIQAAHVPEGGAIGDATGWATIATVVAVPGVQEVALSGANVLALVKAAASITTGDTRVVAIRGTAGTGAAPGGNGVVVPAGTMTIALEPVFEA